MPWIQLKLNTTGANAEDLSDALMEAGSVSSHVEAGEWVEVEPFSHLFGGL